MHGNIDVLAQPEREPSSLLEELPEAFDEVQRASEWLPAINRKVNTTRKQGRGPVDLALMGCVAESRAGRAVISI
ncbi:MAG: hypothetical protein HZA31_00915 [Opitutae bacterium]|nr:hypothetical protein [Opitutae bacterium]